MITPESAKGLRPVVETLLREAPSLDRWEFYEALIPAGLGCHVGGGTGLRYSYINLALTDVAAAIPRIKEVLRQCRAPPRTWLLLFDDVWCDEWIGVWDTTHASTATRGRRVAGRLYAISSVSSPWYMPKLPGSAASC